MVGLDLRVHTNTLAGYCIPTNGTARRCSTPITMAEARERAQPEPIRQSHI